VNTVHIPMNKLRNSNKVVVLVLLLGLVLVLIKTAGDLYGYRLLDAMNSPEDKQVRDQGYGTSHK
jgi:uncharacterized membrane protein